MPTIYQIIIITLAVAFIVLVLDKTSLRYRLRDKCDSKGLNILAELLDCDFCLGFWLAVILSAILSLLTQQSGWLTTSFLSAPLIRIII